MATTLSQSNGAIREKARAFVAGWQYADRMGKPGLVRSISVPDEHVPRNQILLAEFLAGICSRLWGLTPDLESALAILGEG